MGLNAIRLASEASVREVLLGICDDDRVEERALLYFSRLEPQHAAAAAGASALNSPSAYVDILNQASEASIRAILIAVCNDVQTKEAALGYLAQLEPDAVQTANDHPAAADRRAGKRKAVGLAICVQCEEAFDEADNRVMECVYHPGEMVPHLDSDVWSDIDPECYNRITAQNFGLSRPRGFSWSCCMRNGDEPGCRFSRHVSDPARNKRARSDGSSLSSLDDEPGVAEDAYAIGGQVLEEQPGQGFLKSVDEDELRDTTEDCDLRRDRVSSPLSKPPTNISTPPTLHHPQPQRHSSAQPRRSALSPEFHSDDPSVVMLRIAGKREGPLFSHRNSPDRHLSPDHTDDFHGWHAFHVYTEWLRLSARDEDARTRAAANRPLTREERAARRNQRN